MKIAIVLEALTGSFITDMDKAGKEAKKQAEKMRREWEAAGNAIGLAVAGGVASLALLTKQAINTADQMAKMSQKVGVSVESLSTLKYAADQSGVSIETLQSSLVRLTKNASDAAKGTGDAIQGFNALGISVASADGKLKSSDALLVEIAEKFASFEDGANKTALAVNLFGKSGAELIPMLNAGASGIDELRQRARDLGLELDTNTAKQAEQFNDLMADAANLAKGFGNDLAKSLLPALVSLAKVFVDNGIEGRKASDAVEMVSGAIKTTAGVAIAGVAQVQKFGAILGMVAAQVDVFFTTIGKNFAAFQQYQRDIFDIGPIDAFVKFTETGFGNVSSALDQASGNMDALKESFSDIDDDATRKIAALNATLSSTGSAAENVDRTVTTLGGTLDTATGKVIDLYTHTAKLKDVTGDVDAMLAQYAYTLADDAGRAQMDYEDSLQRILELEMAWLELGPMSEAQIAKLNQLRAMAGEKHRRDMQGLSDEVQSDAAHAAEMSGRAWEDFSLGLADAVLQGSKGVKTYFKRLLDDMKKQLLASGLMNIFSRIFNVSGSAGGMPTSMLGTMLGGGAGGLLGGLGGAGSLFGGGGLMTAMGSGIASVFGGAGLAGGFTKGFGALFSGGGMAGIASGIGQMLPMIGAVLAVSQIVDKISGGKLFGTSYKFESASRNIAFSGAGVSGQDSLTEVRQRSLFRGRRWQTTNTALDAETRSGMEAFWNAILEANTEIARTFGREAAIDVPASFKQEFDKDGKVIKEIGTIMGRTYAESFEIFGKRVAAENILANIDGMFSALVAGGTGPGFGGFDGSGGNRGPIKGDQQVMAVMKGVTGEASAIAERWRHDAELLMEGAQFLLLAATDIHHGTGLLGEGGTLTQVTALIEGLQQTGETLSEAYVRVATATALLDEALSLSGVSLDMTRAQFVTFATEIADAAGGLDRAQALWGVYFEAFYTEQERALYTLGQATTAAEKELSDIGRTIDDFSGETGLQDFRAQFEAVLALGDAAQVAQWLEAAAALGFLKEAQEAYNATLDESAETINKAVQDILSGLETEASGLRTALAGYGLSDYAKQQAQIARETQDAVAQAMEAGATEAEVLKIEILGLERASLSAALAMRQFSDELADWEFEDYLAGLSELDAAVAREGRKWEERYASAIELFGEGSDEAIRVLGLWDAAIGRLTVTVQDASRAAEDANRNWADMGTIIGAIKTFGEQLDATLAQLKIGDAMSAWLSELSGLPRVVQQGVRKPLRDVVALVRKEYADQAADLARQIERQYEALGRVGWQDQARRHLIEGRIAELERALAGIGSDMGAALEQLKEMYLVSLKGIQDYLDGMLIGDLSILTPAEQLAEAWAQLQKAVDAGDTASVTRMADTYLQLLREFYASGTDYNQGWQSVRDLLQGMMDIDIDDLFGPSASGAEYMAEAQLSAAETANDWLAQIAANTAYYGSVPAYASGGWVNGPTTLMAGEAGRELILPNAVSEFFARTGIPINTGSGGVGTAELIAELRKLGEKLDNLQRDNREQSRDLVTTIDTVAQRSDREITRAVARDQSTKRGVMP